MHMQSISGAGAAVLALALVGTPANAQDAASPAAAVLDRHLAAFAAHDVEAIMADYTDASVFITPDRVFSGTAEIQTLFEGLVAEFSAPEASLGLIARHAVGPLAYTTWSAETPQNSYTLATDTLYVEDGRILYQTFAAEIVPK